MKKWLSIALLGLLFLPACAPKPTGDNGAPADNGSASQGFVVPDAPAPVVQAEWLQFCQKNYDKLDKLFKGFPGEVFVRCGDVDGELLDKANVMLEHCSISLTEGLSIPLDSMYSAQIVLKYLKQMNVTPQQLPDLYDMLNKIVTEAAKLSKPPADLDNSLAYYCTFLKYRIGGASLYYNDNQYKPTKTMLDFNKSAVRLVSMIDDFNSYPDILDAVIETKRATRAAIAEKSIPTADLQCMELCLNDMSALLKKNGVKSSLDDQEAAADKSASGTSSPASNGEPSATGDQPQPDKPEAKAAPEPQVANENKAEAKEEVKPEATKDAATKKKEAESVPAASVATNGSESNKPQYPTNKAVKTNSGLEITILQAGKGARCKKGDMVSVHYSGTFEDGTVFDSSYTRKLPLEFPLGLGYVIDGWEEGVLGMQVGEKRHLVIPPNLGYGAQGSGPIPANATLIFDVELLKIE